MLPEAMALWSMVSNSWSTGSPKAFSMAALLASHLCTGALSCSSDSTRQKSCNAHAIMNNNGDMHIGDVRVFGGPGRGRGGAKHTGATRQTTSDKANTKQQTNKANNKQTKYQGK